MINKLAKFLTLILLFVSSSVFALFDPMVPGHYTENNRDVILDHSGQTYNVNSPNVAQGDIVLRGVEISEDRENIHPTEEFFNALIECKSGDYFEENRMADILGGMFLSHSIYGIEKNYCHVKMQAPNSHMWNCYFDLPALNKVDDQYLVEGLIEFNVEDPSTKSIRAETDWGLIKRQYCVLER